MVIKLKAKKAKHFRPGLFRLEYLNEFQRTAPEIKKDFGKTFETWESEKPTVRHKAFLSEARNPTLHITIDSKVWWYLEEGTAVRYATMSRDFQAKTVPNVIGSRPGRGRKLFVDKKRPRPGIKARRWRRAIERKWQKPLQKRMNAASKRAAKKSGHSLK